ncbi:MAG: hypothetical protein SOX97_10080, partial [Sutterella sp.]|nr:hypothetical protein [Sutterella sp.]
MNGKIGSLRRFSVGITANAQQPDVGKVILRFKQTDVGKRRPGLRTVRRMKRGDFPLRVIGGRLQAWATIEKIFKENAMVLFGAVAALTAAAA